MNLADVFTYGPIVFVDEDTCSVITINGSYLNGYSYCDGQFSPWNDCRHVGDENLYTLTVSEAMDKAQDWFDEVIAEEQEEED